MLSSLRAQGVAANTTRRLLPRSRVRGEGAAATGSQCLVPVPVLPLGGCTPRSSMGLHLAHRHTWAQGHMDTHTDPRGWAVSPSACGVYLRDKPGGASSRHHRPRCSVPQADKWRPCGFLRGQHPDGGPLSLVRVLAAPPLAVPSPPGLLSAPPVPSRDSEAPEPGSFGGPQRRPCLPLKGEGHRPCGVGIAPGSTPAGHGCCSGLWPAGPCLPPHTLTHEADP